jgi:hypothetical protein
MHIQKGTLRAHLDGQLSPEQAAQVDDHLSGCRRCRERMEVLEQYAAQAAGALNQDPYPQSLLSTRTARQHFERYILDKEKNHMENRNKVIGIRLAIAGVLIVVLLSILAIPQVQVIANNFLGLFRVEQVAVVPVNLGALDSSMHSGGVQFEQMIASDATITEHGQSQKVGSAAEAANLVDFPLRLPTSTGEPDELSVEAGVTVEYVVDLPRLRAILSELGQDASMLPQSLDRATITVDIPTLVAASYGDCRSARYDPDDQESIRSTNCKVLMQLPSPTIEAPPGLDIDSLAQIFLQAAGMTEQEARRFSERIDWATTLVIPIPSNATSNDITVDGVQGVLVESRGSSYMLVWVKDGILYALSGMGDTSPAFQMANSLEAR